MQGNWFLLLSDLDCLFKLQKAPHKDPHKTATGSGFAKKAMRIHSRASYLTECDE